MRIDQTKMIQRCVLTVLQRGMIIARNEALVGNYTQTQKYLLFIERIPEFLLSWDDTSLARLECWLEEVKATNFLGLLNDRVPIWSSFGSEEKIEIALDETVRIFLLDLIQDSIKHLVSLPNTKESMEETAELMDALELIPVHLGTWNRSSRKEISMCLNPTYKEHEEEFESLFEKLR